MGAMTGDAGKSLADKLGAKPGMRMLVVGAPERYRERLPEGVETAGRLEFIQYFALNAAALEDVLSDLAARLEPNGMLWVSWTKKSSPRHNGLSDTVVREMGLAAGLVDVKVASVDDDWSAMKFVYRLKDRK